MKKHQETHKLKIYISGKITGLTKEEYESNFAKAEELIRRIGHEVVNPVTLKRDKAPVTWHDYMRDDVKALMDCDAIYMLNGWTDSRGAILERDIAFGLEMPMYYESHGHLVCGN